MSQKTPKVLPREVILCDDVRREDNGKFLMIGVYTGGIVVHQLPYQMPLALLLSYEPVGLGKITGELQIQAPDSSIIAGVKLDIDLVEPNKKYQSESFLFSGIPLKVANTGDYSIKFRCNEEKWETIKIFPVTYQPLNYAPVAKTEMSVESKQPSSQ